MDGFLKAPPSDTPQKPWSQACTNRCPARQSPTHSAQNALTRAFAKRVGGGITTLNPHPTRSEWMELAAA